MKAPVVKSEIENEGRAAKNQLFKVFSEYFIKQYLTTVLFHFRPSMNCFHSQNSDHVKSVVSSSLLAMFVPL